jgi:hypothetical protein
MVAIQEEWWWWLCIWNCVVAAVLDSNVENKIK